MYAAVTVKVHSVDATVDFVYVRTGVLWKSRELIKVRVYCSDIVFLYGDYNAHYKSWVDARSDARGEAFFDVVVGIRLIVLNDRRETFVRCGVSGSAMDLSFSSIESRSCVL